MYEHVFNLTSRPFTSAPYVKHYFPGSAIAGTHEQCFQAIQRGSGPAVVVGAHGTGKTLLLAKLADEFRTDFRVLNVSAAHASTRSELLQSVLFELKQNYRDMDENEMRLTLVDAIKQLEGPGVLLLVDDAQDLNVETAQEIQQLTNLVREGQPLVRVIIAGTSGLEERLADTRLAALNQRICVRSFLANLSAEEVEAYVRAHIERSGGKPSELFDDESFRAIREVTDGCPRHINQVCDHAMIFAATRGQKPITDSLIRETWFDIQQIPGIPASVSTSKAPAESEPQSVAGVTMEEDSEGWTVLEFGSLSEDNAEAASDQVPVDTFEQTQFETEAQQPEDEPSDTFAESTVQAVEESEEQLQPKEQTEIADFTDAATPTDEADEAVVEGIGQAATVTGAVSGAAALAAAMAAFREPALAETDEFSQAQESKPESNPEPEPEPEPSETNGGSETEVSGNELSSSFDVGIFEKPESSEPTDAEVASNPEIEPEESEVQEEVSEIPSFDASPVETSPESSVENLPILESQIAPEQTADEPSLETPVAASSDPFGSDEFEDEEVLVDAYAPFVAKQNERSLDVTSSDLSGLTPTDEDSVAGGIDGRAFQTDAVSSVEQSAEETFPTMASALASASPVRKSVDIPLADQRVTQETRATGEANGPESLSDEFTVAPEAGAVVPIEPTVALTQVEVEPAVYAPESDVFPLEPEPGNDPQASSEHTDSQDLPATTDYGSSLTEVGPTASRAFADSVAAAAISDKEKEDTGFHEQTSGDVSPEVRSQAEEIIRNLNLQLGSDPASPPLPQVDALADETAAIEQTIQKTAEQHTIATSTAVPQVVIPVDSLAATDGINPEMDILEEVREQTAMVQDQAQSQEAPVSYQMPEPVVPASPADDQDILKVAQSETTEPKSVPVEEPLPEYAKQEPSTGSALRVDYEKLFQQLRNIDQSQD